MIVKANWTKGISDVLFSKTSFGYELSLWLDRKWPSVNHATEFSSTGKRCKQFLFDWDDGQDEPKREYLTFDDEFLKHHLMFDYVEKDTFHAVWISYKALQSNDKLEIEQLTLPF